ncbi:MAG TPA: conjugal transfer protein TraN [Alphaproteobacteria bacterium]|nr:conjugal transfer protein TraN [Alphaproteobacteria bacterium]
MRTLLALLVLLNASHPNMEKSYEEGRNTAKELKGPSFNPSILPNYESSKNFSVSEADLTDSQKIMESKSQNIASQTITESSKNGHYKIDPENDPLFEVFKNKDPKELEEESEEITEYITSTCEEGRDEFEKTCYKTRVVELEITPAWVYHWLDCPVHKEKRRGRMHHWSHSPGCRSNYRTIPKVVKETKDEWIDSCEALESQADEGMCSYVKKELLEENVTKIIQGEQVTKSHWGEAYTYSCLAERPNTCKALRKKGCTEVSSKCKEMMGDVCISYEKTYKCPVKTVKTNVKRKGLDGIFGSDGSLKGPASDPNKDMATAITKMALLREMQKTIASGPTVFTGKAMECSKNPLGFKDCCVTSKKWGQNLGLAECSSDEKELAMKRAKRLCIHVGTYCSKKIAGICVSKRTSFCCFTSKMARLFHEQGRAQLGKNFGTAEGPSCGGFTVDELSRLNFDAMNLSELYESTMSAYKTPNMSVLNSTLNESLSSKLEVYKQKLKQEGKK